jgi:hypothetical protein
LFAGIGLSALFDPVFATNLSNLSSLSPADCTVSALLRAPDSPLFAQVSTFYSPFLTAIGTLFSSRFTLVSSFLGPHFLTLGRWRPHRSRSRDGRWSLRVVRRKCHASDNAARCKCCDNSPSQLLFHRYPVLFD